VRREQLGEESLFCLLEREANTFKMMEWPDLCKVNSVKQGVKLLLASSTTITKGNLFTASLSINLTAKSGGKFFPSPPW